jgi:hypothetical protein
MSGSLDTLKKLIQSIANTHEEEIDCGEAHRLLDEYTEAEARGDDLASLLPTVKQHLDMCRGCFEEQVALLNVLNNI